MTIPYQFPYQCTCLILASLSSSSFPAIEAHTHHARRRFWSIRDFRSRRIVRPWRARGIGRNRRIIAKCVEAASSRRQRNFRSFRSFRSFQQATDHLQKRRNAFRILDDGEKAFRIGPHIRALQNASNLLEKRRHLADDRFRSRHRRNLRDGRLTLDTSALWTRTDGPEQLGTRLFRNFRELRRGGQLHHFVVVSSCQLSSDTRDFRVCYELSRCFAAPFIAYW